MIRIINEFGFMVWLLLQRGDYAREHDSVLDPGRSAELQELQRRRGG